MIEENSKALPRMRTIPKAYEELRTLDPNTGLSMKALRDMIKRGEIPSVKINGKSLVNLDLIIEKLSGVWYNNGATHIPSR